MVGAAPLLPVAVAVVWRAARNAPGNSTSTAGCDSRRSQLKASVCAVYRRIGKQLASGA